jgi:multicomponent Na+:H+ antiporter subunit G
MSMVVEILSWVCIGFGSIFMLIGCLGLLRLPDVFSRMHGGGVAETLGFFLLFAGMAIQAFVILDSTMAAVLVVIKLFLIALFLFFTNPTTTHALAQAALWGGIDPKTGRAKDREES